MPTRARSRFLPAVLAVALLLPGDCNLLAQAQHGRPELPLAEAIQAYEKLIQSQPDSPQIRDTLYRLGQAYQSIGSYREAAAQYETLAQRFAGEVDKPDDKDHGERVDIPSALEQAALLRRGLGETDKYVEDVGLFVRHYGDRRELSERAAGLFFALGQHYEERKDVAKLKPHYIEYLRTWADRGGIDRRIIAEVTLGELAWRSSCPVPGVSGACIDIKNQRNCPVIVPAKPYNPYYRENRRTPLRVPTRCQRPLPFLPCGYERKALIAVHARNPTLVNEAMAHFQTALKLHGSAATPFSHSASRQLPLDRLERLTYHIARARMAQGDVLYEELIQMPLPSGLVVEPNSKQMTGRARQRFSAWMHLKRRKLDEAKARYEQAMALKNSYFTVAAAARISQLYLAFANGMYYAAVPAPPPPPPKFRGYELDPDEWIEISKDAFCDYMVDSAEPLDQLAKEQLQRCLSKSAELGEASEWSRLCEEELYQLSPREYPLPSEIFFEPGSTAGTLDIAPVQAAGSDK